MITAAETARLRQGLYRLFGVAFASPETELLTELRSAAHYLEGLEPSRFAFYTEWRDFAQELDETEGGPALLSEHVRLFASGARDDLCPPVESYHRAGGQMESAAEIAAAIEADYRAMGLAVVGTSHATDHVATQLEIMSTLCGREVAAWEMGLHAEADAILESQERFLRRHLGAWLPELRSQVVEAQRGGYYAALAEAVHSFVVHDQLLIIEVRRWTGAVV